MEEWRAVVGNDAYEVSSEGRVRRVTAARGTYAGRILRPALGSHGYYGVHLGHSDGRLVHRLMAEAFLPPIAGRTHVNHIDGDKRNNRIENLEWSNKSLNQQHAMAMGLYAGPPLKQGTAQPNAKLTDAQVLEIRKARAAGAQLKPLAAAYGVSFSLIHYVCNHGWKHLTPADCPAASPAAARPAAPRQE
jgi:hypothetical protein